jgi:mannose-1-phosphate guanylyltransferase/mannose-6-phosphate isomerase
LTPATQLADETGVKQRIIPAIMSGGAGTRLWPLSTDAEPKQFHAIASATSLFRETLARVQGEHDGIVFCNPIVLCNERHSASVRSELEDAGVSPSAIILEPVGRNTAAVAAIAAAAATEIDNNALLLLTPADHLIGDIRAFHSALERGASVAADYVVTLGITPTGPATGYGYIERGGELGKGVFAIASFREKPDEALARRYINTGRYYWNSGMFLSHPRTMLAAFDVSPEVRDRAIHAFEQGKRQGTEILLGDEFAQTPELPFDKAVMEKTKKGAVAPCDMQWADLGAWDEIWRLSPKDGSGNAVQGSVVAVESANNLLRAEGIRLCVAGVQDLVVIATKDAVIVLPRERAQDVKTLKELASRL